MSSAPTVTVWSDIGCPWAAIAVHRLHAARERLGLAGAVAFEHRVFALEIVNARPTPRSGLDAEIPVIGALEPDVGLAPWSGRDSAYPVSTLLAMEAVQAVQAQRLGDAESLDVALRRAMFVESRCIAMRHVVLDVAKECGSVDVEALERALDDGTARRLVIDQHRAAVDGPVDGSPHLFVGDRGWHNPGVDSHVDRERKVPVVDGDDPSVYDEILQAAAAL